MYKELFEAVLPQEGFVCLTALVRGKGGAQQEFYPVGSEEIAEAIKRLDTGEREVYFATATFKDQNKPRNASNILSKKAFYLDLDCGENKHYATQADAVERLQSFCDMTGLPAPTLVDSGHGVHAYWALTEAIPYNTWRPIADTLKTYTTNFGLHADSSVTADGSRILRIPGTTNRKRSSDLRSVKVRGSIKPPILLEDFETAIGHYESDDRADHQIDKVMKALMAHTSVFRFSRIKDKCYKQIEVTAWVSEEYELPNGQIANKSIKKKVLRSAGCPQIAFAIDNRETLEEKMWRAALSTAQCCEDRDFAIHEVSKGYHDYTPQATEEKADKTKGGYNCEEWRKASMQPQLCSECTWRGKIKNPLALGARIEEAQPEDNQLNVVHFDTKLPVTIEVPSNYPPPWLRPKIGGVAFRGLSDKIGADHKGDDRTMSEEDPDETLVYPRDLWVKSRLKDDDREFVEMALCLPNDGLIEFKAPLSDILKVDKCQEILNNHGCAVHGKVASLLRSYIGAWVNHLQDVSSAVKTRPQFGWCDNHTRFTIGGREIDDKGEIHNSPVQYAIENVAKIFRKKGQLSEWTQMANRYAGEGNEARAFGLFCSFGAPLYGLLGEGSMVVHLTNVSSGVGKSTIQKVGQSVWGSPTEGLMTSNDTVNARLHRMGILNSLPAFIDEITNIKSEAVSQFVFDLSAGRAKNRLKSGGNEERINHSTWATMILTSGNNSLYDLIHSHKAVAEGEIYRVVEIPVLQDTRLTKPEADKYYGDILLNNYGLAGEEYMRYVVPKLYDVKQRLLEWRSILDKECNLSSKERFYSSCFAAAFTGAEIANELGIIDIPIEPIRKWVNGVLADVREIVERASMDSEDKSTDLLSQYWKHNFDRILVTHSGTLGDGASSSQHTPILREPHGGFFGRHDKEKKMLYISKSEFEAWLSNKHVSSNQTMKGWHGNTKLVFEGDIDLGYGTLVYTTTATRCYGFDLSENESVE